MPPSIPLFSASLRRRVLRLHLDSANYRLHRLHSVVEYPLTHPIYTIWASNTSVGKTLVSAGLSISAYKPLPFSVFSSNYIFNASIPASDAVFGKGDVGGSIGNENLGAGLEKERNFGWNNLRWYEERKLLGRDSNESELAVSEVVCNTMHSWKEAVSPHLAAEKEGATVGFRALASVKEILVHGFGENMQ